MAGVSSSFPQSQEEGRGSQVFLSFRSLDVRNTIAGHLRSALHRQGLRTYLDDEDLHRGEDIASSLLKAIEDSRIAIVIFSENYASSRWCLDELATIIERRKRGSLAVWLIFYRVDPGKVGDRRGSLCSALPPFEEAPDKVKMWRESLSEAVSLHGCHLDDYVDEAELIRNVVKEVIVLLGRTPLDVPRYPADEPSGHGRYPVFLSFMGSDVRNHILSHLKDALCWEGIRTFAEGEEPQEGDEISPVLMKAIEDSQIAVILFSPNYASSTWCLRELEMIMESRKLGKLKVKPVYYRVDPQEVRGPMGSYEQALHNHETRGMLPERIKRMREVINEATSLSGWHLDANRNEAKVIRSIVKDINVSLDRVPLDVIELRRCYDVFLSFRGPDSRHTIISHLYPALCQKGVSTFKDSESLEAGERRSELFKAIKGSRIAVVMFSENYAFSKWCLDELKVIMDRKEVNVLTVLPIFYRVSPEEVRLRKKDNGAKGCYQIAMEEMEAKYGKNNPEMVESWKKALWNGGDLIGFTLHQGEDEGVVLRRVVEKVLNVLNHVTLEVAEKPVGMRTRLHEVKRFLHIDPHVDDVYMLGILGQGGVGKTTLSKAILKEHFRKFDDWCFLPNIREESKAMNGLAGLQQKLLRKLLGQADLTVWSVDQGKALIEQRLRNKNVLIILDDIDNYDQFDALAGNLNWFGKRSRIVITTRNRHVLPSDRVQQIYEVGLLNEDEAEALFQGHAFPGCDGKIDTSQFPVDRFLVYAAGLPLALVVFGKFLRDRSAIEWVSTLGNLEKNPHGDVNSVLKISYDGLSEEEKPIFLDIACFFKGRDKKYVLNVLRSCSFETEIGIKVLVERCLISDEGDKFQMHDLIEAMGRSIVRDECSKAGGIPSRIWLYNDFADVLSEERVPTVVRAIVVLNSTGMQPDEVVNGSTFKGLYRLRLLIVRNAFDIEGSLHLPRELRWFEWPGLSVSTIVFSDPRKIVAINLMGSNVEQILGKAFPELKYLNLCNCKSLNSPPNLSRSSKLEDLNLRGCKNLTTLDDLIGSLEKLVHLDLGECDNLTSIPSSLRSKEFRTLDFYGCSKLDKFPTIEKELWYLGKLSLEKTAVKELPDSIHNLVVLKVLNLNFCKELATIPSSIYKLLTLEKLSANGCPKLEKFPRRDAGDETDVLPSLVLLDLQYCNFKEVDFLMDLTCFGTLKELRLLGNDFTHLPACVSKFENLEELWLCSCESLVEVPDLPDHAQLYIRGCRKLRALSNFLPVLRRTHRRLHVDLSNCHSLDLSNIDTSLSIEMIRGFGGSVEAIVPGEAFSRWMDIQITECRSSYVVPLPDGMTEDDVLGLALSVTFAVTTNTRDASEGDFLPKVKFMIGHREDISISALEPWEGVHTWFVYLPRQPLSEKSEYLAEDIDWSNITIRIKLTGMTLKHCGLRVVCKQESDDRKFLIREKEERIDDECDYESE